MNNFYNDTLNNTEEPSVVYALNPCVSSTTQFKTNFKNNDMDMSRLSITSHLSQNTSTKIACAVSSDVTKGLIEELCERGVSMVVFDFNNLSYEECRAMVYEIRHGVFNYSLNQNHRVPYSLALVLDLGQPSIVTGTIYDSKPEQRLNLPTNGEIYVTNDVEFRDKCTENRIYVNSDQVLRLNENDLIFLDYGKIELVVKKVVFSDVLCLIKRGELLGSRKVVHIPGVPVDISALAKQHERNISVGTQLKVDIMLVPGVRDAAYFNTIRDLVDQDNIKIDWYAKIDNLDGLQNIDQIIRVTDGVFLHRPELSMQVGQDKIFLVQKTILSKCNTVGKPTVMCGGFLESMELNAAPTSTEVGDLVSAVLDGTDCVYLDLTKLSSYKVDCVRHASSVCRQAEVAIKERRLDSSFENQYKSKLEPIQGISVGCVEVSLKCNAAAIIVISTTGLSAKTIARYRPTCPVLAIVRHGTSARKISVWRNLIAVQYIDPIETVWLKEIEHRTQFAIDFGKKKGIFKQGDIVVHMSSSKPNAGFPNSMLLLHVHGGDFIEDDDEYE